MVIKALSTDAAHGGDIINYDMEKENAVMIKMQFLEDNSLGFIPTPDSVYNQMLVHQELSEKHCKKPFWRFEVCPSDEESAGWTKKDWKKLCDDAIAELDKKGFNLSRSQLICYLHRDTEHWHLHIAANRISMDNEVASDFQFKTRAREAAENLAKARGWKLASEVKEPIRKTKIRKDAYDVLKVMNKFDMRDFFERMKARGYIVDAKYDSQGNCKGYSIGDDKDVMFKSSSLPGRDLMPSRILKTWNALHHQDLVVSRENAINPVEKNAGIEVSWNGFSDTKKEYGAKAPVWKCSDYTAKENWRDPGYTARIPEKAYDFIKDNVPLVNPIDYFDKNIDIPDVASIIAVAIYEFLIAEEYHPSGGGGGGTKNDLRWDGLTEDDLRAMAEGAARKAGSKCTAGLTKRKGKGLGH